MDEKNELDAMTEFGLDEPIDPVEVEKELDDGFDDEEDLDLSFVEKVIGVYIAPVNTFKALAVRPDFWGALIIVSLLMIAFGMLALPKTMPFQEALAVSSIQDMNLPEQEETETIALTVKITRISLYLGSSVLIPLILAVGWLLGTALIFFISLMQGLDTDFKRLLGVVPWISLISILSQIGTNIIYMTQPIADAAQLQDFRFLKPFSLIAMVPESVDLPGWQSIILSTIDPFYIWALIVTVFALEAANRCKRGQAVLTTAISTIISLAIIAGLGAVGMAVQGG